MRVGLDAHMVGAQETGNEVYVRGLVEGFRERPDAIDLVVYHLREPWTSPGPHLRFQRLISGNSYLRLGAELPLRSLSQRLDLLHTTYVAPAFSAAPVVLSVHDISFESHPEWFSARDLRMLSTVVPWSVRRAAHVLAISDHERRRIIERYQVPEGKITAIHIGPGPAARPIGLEEARRELKQLGLDRGRPYLLSVGNLQPRKNFIRLVQAYRELSARGHDVDLVVVGPKRYRGEEVIEAAGPVRERVHFTGFVGDRALSACYRCAQAFVYPTLYEGFGIPVVEAMAHGTPVACSTGGALPETCGGAAVMFDPLSAEAMAAAIERILADPAERKRLAKAGKERAKAFSWRRTAERTAEVYRRLA